MEVIALAIILGIGSEINKNADHIQDLQAQVLIQDKYIRDLEGWVDVLDTRSMKQAAAHSSFYSNQQLANEKHDQIDQDLSNRVESVDQKLNYVNEKIDILHP